RASGVLGGQDPVSLLPPPWEELTTYEPGRSATRVRPPGRTRIFSRSEEHTSELQSRSDLVCRLLLEKKKNINIIINISIYITIVGHQFICVYTIYLISLMILRPQRSTLFPYTTLFRSGEHQASLAARTQCPCCRRPGRN